MKKIFCTIILLILTLIALGQPANDCAENAMVINQCGAAFSITQAQMGTATTDQNCVVGGSCPINYVNGQGYENFDCNNSTGNAAGDDFNGSIENSVWWTFIPQETCDYNVQIIISNCCCKDKGSINAAQFQIFDADALLPGGTIQNIMAYQTGVVGTFTPTISVTSGNPVYILLDGLNGTDCDISVTITPQANCTGCNILPVELIEFQGLPRYKSNYISWVTATETNNDYFILQKSYDVENWEEVVRINGNGTVNAPSAYSYSDGVSEEGITYYRLLQVDFNGAIDIFQSISVQNNLSQIKVKHIRDLMGNKLKYYRKGLMIYEYEDGTYKKVFHK